MRKPSWIDSGVTGFIIRTSPDLKKTLSVHRLPWQSASITTCVVGTDGPDPGATFRFSPVKWASADAEFRDPTGRLWPSFFFGKPEFGVFKFDPEKPILQCVIPCDRGTQPNGDPSRRIMGYITAVDGKQLDMVFEIKSTGPFLTRQKQHDVGGKERKREVVFTKASAVMKAQGRSIPVTAECQFTFHYPSKETRPDQVQLDCRFSVTADNFGLKHPDAAKEIQVRISAAANSEASESSR